MLTSSWLAGLTILEKGFLKLYQVLSDHRRPRLGDVFDVDLKDRTSPVFPDRVDEIIGDDFAGLVGR